MDVPDDDWRGGALHFEFSGIPDLVIVEVLEVTLLDFEKFSTMEIVAKDDKTSVYGISPGQDGSSQTINTEGSGKIKEMTVNFPESGGVGMIKMCVENPLIRGDPHVRTIDNQRVNVFLEVGPWVEMMRGPTFALFGHVFNKANDRSTQWIDGLAVVDAEQKTVLNITIPHDKAVGEVHDRDGISYLRVDFDGIELDATNRAYSYFSKKNETLLTLNATKLSSSVRGGRSPIYNDKLTVETPDFTFVAEVGREDNRKNFDSLEEQIGYTHIDAGFPVLDPETVHGPLVDIIYGKDTPAARMWRDKANAYGAAVRVSR